MDFYTPSAPTPSLAASNILETGAVHASTTEEEEEVIDDIKAADLEALQRSSNSNNTSPSPTPATLTKRPARQARFKTVKKVKACLSSTPPLTRGKRRLSSTASKSADNTKQGMTATKDNATPANPPTTTSCEHAEEIQKLWTALERLQRSVHAQQEDKEEEAVSAVKLAEELGELQRVVAQRFVSMDKRVDGLANEVKELDRGHNGLLDRLNDFLDATAESHKHLEDTMAEGFAKFQEREATRAAIAGPEAAPPPPQEANTAFYITGIPALRDSMASFLGPRADPNDVLVQLLREVGAAPCIQRIQLLGPKGAREDRLRTRAAIIQLTSPYHKTTAMVRIKRLLTRHGLQQVVIEDCFPPSQKEEAMRLRAEGASLKEAGTINRFRVINRNGTPVLQVATTTRDRYSDYSSVSSPAEAARVQLVEAAASTGGTEAQRHAARASSPPKPGAGLSRGGNARLATPHHQTEARRNETGGRGEAGGGSSAEGSERQRLSPSALHHVGGERQKAVNGQHGPLNSEVRAGGNATARLMAMAGYSQPHSMQQGNSHTGARPKAASQGPFSTRH